ncbi:hypothetical protein NC651_015875 [Populus alba x Populus x berolinensis]|nr:hypothetical protein NC651_015875 [Populus alba x Populus x berolinensis]
MRDKMTNHFSPSCNPNPRPRPSLFLSTIRSAFGYCWSDILGLIALDLRLMVGFALLYAHGTYDLFLDDQEGANAGFLSFLGGDASSAAAPAGVAHYEYQVKLQKKQWRDDLKRLKETEERQR